VGGHGLNDIGRMSPLKLRDREELTVGQQREDRRTPPEKTDSYFRFKGY